MFFGGVQAFAHHQLVIARTLAHIRALIRSDRATVSWTHSPVGHFEGPLSEPCIRCADVWKWRAPSSSFPVGRLRADVPGLNALMRVTVRLRLLLRGCYM